MLTDIATGWTECVPVVMRAGALALEALRVARELFPFPLKGVDFDNDGAFMNEPVVAWCRAEGLEATRSRAYRKNDQAWVEEKNGAIVRRLVGYGRFEGPASAAALARLYAAARLHTNLFQPSFKLREKTRVGARVTKRWHAPATPADRALASGRLDADSAAHIADLNRPEFLGGDFVWRSTPRWRSSPAGRSSAPRPRRAGRVRSARGADGG